MKRLLTCVLLALPVLARAEDLGMNNHQYVNQPPGDPSVVEQSAAPGSRDNLQSATVLSPGRVPNVTLQSTDGGGNVQTSVQNGGSGNVVIQTQRGTGNRQTVTQTGDGNVAIQSQSGQNRNGTLNQRGGATDMQNQN
jgi:hypothetical protein